MSTSTRSRWLTVGLTSLTTVAALAVAGPAPAAVAPPAGTIRVRLGAVLLYTAGAGVSNQVRVQSTQDPNFYLHDDSATVTIDKSAKPFCLQVDARSVRCKGLGRASILLGDGKDQFVYEGYSALAAFGGAGDDKLTSFRFGGTVSFDGGDGRDTCVGDIDFKANCEA
jgi:Ca2+-binding RTX toxin-like protein